MTIRDLLEYGEKCLREDSEYWEQMDKFRGKIEELINQHRAIMALTIIRLALAMVTEQSTEEEGKKNDEDNDGIIGKR